MTAIANELKSALVWIILLLVTIVGLVAVPRHVSAQRTAPALIRCDHGRPKIRVLSSADQKVYKVDVCAVVDSAEGEDFRMVDKPESKGEN